MKRPFPTLYLLIAALLISPAARPGPFALQMHNKGLLDQYANIAIQENPTTDDFLTTH